MDFIRSDPEQELLTPAIIRPGRIVRVLQDADI